MTDAPRRMDGYVRVSRRMGRAGPAYISIPVQRDAIQRWADYRGVEIVAWHIDEDESGGTQSRPGLIEAMRRIEAGETDGLACWRLNRFARNVAGAITDVERIQTAGGQLALVEEQIDPTGPFGTFLLTVLLAVATLERDNAVAGFVEAKRRAVERGAYISRTPFGYQRQPDGTLEPHSEHAQIVAEAFRLAAGDSVQAAMGYLERAVRDRRWTTTTVRRLLSGRSYLGETRNGDMVRADTHEPLVSRAIWEAAQSSPSTRRPNASFPLTGLLECGTCGARMVGGRGGKGQRTYRCSATLTTNRGECERGAVVTAHIVEEYVRDHARDLLAGLRFDIGDPDADALTVLERAVLDAEAELDAFAGDLRLRQVLGARYHAHLETRAVEVERARGAYREHSRRAQTELTVDVAAALEGDDVMLTAMLRGMFVSIVVRPGRGLQIGDRVRFLPADRDGSAGIADSQDP